MNIKVYQRLMENKFRYPYSRSLSFNKNVILTARLRLKGLYSFTPVFLLSKRKLCPSFTIP